MHPAPEVGSLIEGRYKVERTLGVGGMAIVLAAHDELLDKSVAVKLLSQKEGHHSTTVLERFMTEARAAARIHSPHVARVLDVGTFEGDASFMVLERLDGCDLEELVALEKRLDVKDAVDFTLQALHGVANAHAIGIVHRDIKPANLFLAHLPDGTNLIKILDFGVAKLTEGAGGKAVGAVTMEGVTVGSPMYMSPEQVRSSKNVDHRTDLWALGAVLYELLTGKPPFTGDGVGEIFAAVLERTPPSIRAVRPDVPEGLEAVVMRLLERDLDRRYADAAEAARALAPFGSGRWEPLVPSIAQTLARKGATSRALQPKGSSGDVGAEARGAETLDAPSRRARWPWALAAVAVVALGVALGVRWTSVPRVADTPSVAAAEPSTIALMPVATTSAQAPMATPPPSAVLLSAPRATSNARAPRPKSSRPAILDSPY